MSSTTVMLYKGKAIIPRLIPREKWASLVLDAKRIMGTEPALNKGGVSTPGMFRRSVYLEPPEKGSSTWDYARHILSLSWSVYLVKGWKIVGAHELEEIAPIPLIRREPNGHGQEAR